MKYCAGHTFEIYVSHVVIVSVKAGKLLPVSQTTFLHPKFEYIAYPTKCENLINIGCKYWFLHNTDTLKYPSAVKCMFWFNSYTFQKVFLS